MKKLKELYSSPTTELLVVRFEGNFCNTGYHQGGGGSYNDGEDINDNGDF